MIQKPQKYLDGVVPHEKVKIIPKLAPKTESAQQQAEPVTTFIASIARSDLAKRSYAVAPNRVYGFKRRRPWVFNIVGSMVLLAGILSLGLIIRDNRHVVDQVNILQQKVHAESAAGSGGSDETADTQGELPQPVISTKPAHASIFDYKPTGKRPKRIEIKRLGVLAKIVEVGLNKKGQMDVPISIYDAGWYKYSSLTQDEVGATVIVGHIGSHGLEGIFQHINDLRSGDEIIVTNSDDSVAKFKVEKTENVALKDVNMGNYLGYAGSKTETLFLMTCAGNYDKKTFSYDHRTVVKAIKQR